MNQKMTGFLCGLLAATGSVLADVMPYEEVYATRIMSKLDKNGDGKFDKPEDLKGWKRNAKLDANKDGVLTLKELQKAKPAYLETKGERKLNVFYKQTAEESLYLDLYYPVEAKRAAKCPLLVYTHGGGWATGSKHSAASGTKGTSLKKMLDAGFCVAAVNYRLYVKDGTVAMRDCVIDCKDALRFLCKNSDAFGVDPQRVFVLGDSAGGQIAQVLTLSSPESLPGDPALADVPYKIVAGVSYYGPCDFEKTSLFNHDDRENFRDRFGPRILLPDTKPEEKTALYKEMSSIHYLRKNSPPLLMIQGDKDTTIPVKHAYYMQEKAAAVGAPVEIMIIKNAGHNWRQADDGVDIEPSREVIAERTVKFMVEHLTSAQ